MKIILKIIVLIFVAQSLCAAEFKRMKENLNSPGDEFQPVVYRDTLYFRRINPGGQIEVLKIAAKELYEFSDWQPRPANIYSETKYGRVFLEGLKTAADPSTPTFFDFSSDKQSGFIISEPDSFAQNSEFNDMHPALSPDGSFMIFASDRPKTFGRTTAEEDLDLYVTYKDENGRWSRPRNLGRSINTSENEISPYIAPDGTLYYSSRGFRRDSVSVAFSGAGNSEYSDIYIAGEMPNFNIIRATATGNPQEPFGQPEVMPAPVNTEFNETAFTMWQDTLFYVASDRDNHIDGRGFDIYGHAVDKEYLMSLPAQPPEFNSKIPFFVTGYYYPNTGATLSALEEKIRSGKFDGSPTAYIAIPGEEIDEKGIYVDYEKYAVLVEDYLLAVKNSLESWINFIDKRGGQIRINVSGYTDEREMPSNARYIENTISDDFPVFALAKNAPMNNDVLSELRAYVTVKYLQSMLEPNTQYIRNVNNLSWNIAGSGIYKGAQRNVAQRSVKITVNYIPPDEP